MAVISDGSPDLVVESDCHHPRYQKTHCLKILAPVCYLWLGFLLGYDSHIMTFDVGGLLLFIC